MSNYTINHLRELESEAIFVIREVAAQFEKPALLFSGGKDSILMTHLAKKAFYPARIPFPLIHIDTGHNFPETIEFRDRLVNGLGVTLIVGSVQEAIDKGIVKEETGINASRNSLQIVTLLDAIEKHKIDAAMGGARRDEEKARAKERFFSHRDEFGQWDPKNQRPELWNLFNGKKNNGEHFRVFPIVVLVQLVNHAEQAVVGLLTVKHLLARLGKLEAWAVHIEPRRGDGHHQWLSSASHRTFQNVVDVGGGVSVVLVNYGEVSVESVETVAVARQGFRLAVCLGVV